MRGNGNRGAALVDNERDTPARAYALRGLRRDPRVTGVTFLRRPDGRPYTGADFDGEGLVALPQGGLLTASETEPAVRAFDAGGRETGELTVPARFRVAPAGEAVANRTFDGLGLSPDGGTLWAGLEGPLSGDGTTVEGGARLRLLRYERSDDGFDVDRQVGYVGSGWRASGCLVDLGDCPPLDAQSPGTQANPLLDNVEAMALGGPERDGERDLTLLSDDNFSIGQVTRLYRLRVRLPGEPVLEGRATYDALALQPRPVSGQTGVTPANGVTPPFNGQPVPGFSAFAARRPRPPARDARQRLRRQDELGGLPAARLPDPPALRDGRGRRRQDRGRLVHLPARPEPEPPLPDRQRRDVAPAADGRRPRPRVRVIVGNDNNFPGNDGRVPGKPDDTEIIVVRLPRPL